MSTIVRRLRAASLVALPLGAGLLAPATRAGEVTYQLEGEVVSVLAAPGNPNAVAQLDALGAKVGAKLSAVITIDADVKGVPLPGPPFDFVQYDMAVTDIGLTVGSWEAHFAPPPIFETVNFVQVADNASTPGTGFTFDSWSAVALGVDTDGILSNGPVLNHGNFLYAFTQLPPKASNDDGLVQDLSKYKSSRIGTYAGTGGSITVVFDGSGGGGGGAPPDPTALARKGQLKAASWLGKKLLKGLGKLEGKPDDFDPLGALAAALVQDCEDTFGEKFVEAVDKALKKGGTAPLPASGKDQATEMLMQGLLAQFDAIVAGAPGDDPAARALRAKLVKAAGALAGSNFAAYANYAKKPDGEKLDKALDKARATFVKAFEKAVEAANKKGVAYTRPGSSEVAGALLALAQAFDELTKGP